MDKINTVIFDMDGVIIDSESASMEADKRTFAQHGIDVAEEDHYTFKGKRLKDVYSHVIEKYNVSHINLEDLMQTKRNNYLSNIQNIKLFDGFTELIEYLSKKYKIALVTSSGRTSQERTFGQFGLNKYFSEIVTGDMVERGKPHPDPYLLVLKKLGQRGNECIVIEDSDNGVTSAKTAGIRTIAVTHSLPRERLSHADHIVEHLSHIKHII